MSADSSQPTRSFQQTVKPAPTSKGDRFNVALKRRTTGTNPDHSNLNALVRGTGIHSVPRYGAS